MAKKKEATSEPLPPMEVGRPVEVHQDKENPNVGTTRGRQVVRHSLERFGPGRSITVDKNGNVIAGNKTIEQAQALGLPLEFVHTEGDRLVVHVRDDLDLEHDDGRARGLSIADNRASEVGLQWNKEMMADLAKQGNKILEGMWTEFERDGLVRDLQLRQMIEIGGLPDTHHRTAAHALFDDDRMQEMQANAEAREAAEATPEETEVDVTEMEGNVCPTCKRPYPLTQES